VLDQFEQADEGYYRNQYEEDDVCSPQNEAAAGVTLEAAHAKGPCAVGTFCHQSINGGQPAK
jgi:hypothetical protein